MLREIFCTVELLEMYISVASAELQTYLPQFFQQKHSYYYLRKWCHYAAIM